MSVWIKHQVVTPEKGHEELFGLQLLSLEKRGCTLTLSFTPFPDWTFLYLYEGGLHVKHQPNVRYINDMK